MELDQIYELTGEIQDEPVKVYVLKGSTSPKEFSDRLRDPLVRVPGANDETRYMTTLVNQERSWWGWPFITIAIHFTEPNMVWQLVYKYPNEEAG